MDLRAYARSAVRAGAGITKCRVAAILLFAVASPAFAFEEGPDYVYPDQARGGFIEPHSRVHSATPTSKPLALKTYRAFDGRSHSLREYRGRFVSVLLPDEPPQQPFFTAEHIGELVDRLDELYSLYREILQREPPGSDLLTVAFVPQTCGSGCGLLGGRGIEIRSDSRNVEAIIKELDAGRLDEVLVHEMVHNFDAFSGLLHYLPDHPHAWTDFFQYFAAYRYGRHSVGGQAPDEGFNSPVSLLWKTYVETPSASWSQCVRDGGCAAHGLPPNGVWAMPYYRLEAVYGPAAIVRSFEYLTDHVGTGSPPQSPEDKEALRILSLAHGAGVNLACHLDALNWPVSASLRNELQSRFGAPDPACQDSDGDGFTAVTGDCDEGHAARHVLGSEVADNGHDDDCDGQVDEAALAESGSGDGFRGPVATRLPFDVRGSAASVDDSDEFTFAAPASGRARVTLCSAGGFSGWAVALDDRGQYLDAQHYFAYQAGAGCDTATFDFDGLASAGVLVLPESSAGEYSLSVAGAAELPVNHSTFLASLPRPAGGVKLLVDDQEQWLQGQGADQVEFWVSGTGVRQARPYAAGAAITLDGANSPELEDGALYLARMRPLAGGLPLAPFSDGHLFRFAAGQAQLPDVDRGFSGAWYDPAHEGEGFIVEVLDGGQAVVYWFTYDPDGKQRWMLGVGAIDGHRIVIDELLTARGGRFGPQFDPADVELEVVGTLSLDFHGCGSGVANYTVDKVGGSQALARLVGLHGHPCGMGSAGPDEGLSGSWYDPDHNGEGFVVEQISADQALVFWFTYTTAGEQAWFFNTGTIEGGRISFPDLMRPHGGRFGRSFDPATVRFDPWGALELQLGCTGGGASYAPTDPDYPAGAQSLVPLTRLQGSGCAGG